jgi:ankyrin repeat protein
MFTKREDIHVQAAKGNVDTLIALLKERPKRVNLVDKMDYGTPLHWAAMYGQVESCETLISRGAKLDAVDDCGHTPLWWAISGGEVDVVRRLIARGADINTADAEGRTPLQHAVKRGHKEIAAILRKRGAKNGNG